MHALRNITQNDCECRYESGLYFADDRVALIQGDLHIGYLISSHTEYNALAHSDPDGWTDLEFQLSIEISTGTAFGGETSYGGAGFFAFRNSSGFLWVLHLDNMNNPISLTEVDGTLIGIVDSPHPYGSTLRIPINDPERFTVEQNTA